MPWAAPGVRARVGGGRFGRGRVGRGWAAGNPAPAVAGAPGGSPAWVDLSTRGCPGPSDRARSNAESPAPGRHPRRPAAAWAATFWAGTLWSAALWAALAGPRAGLAPAAGRPNRPNRPVREQEPGRPHGRPTAASSPHSQRTRTRPVQPIRGRRGGARGHEDRGGPGGWAARRRSGRAGPRIGRSYRRGYVARLNEPGYWEP